MCRERVEFLPHLCHLWDVNPQLSLQQKMQQEEHERVIREQGPVSYEEALAQTKRSLATTQTAPSKRMPEKPETVIPKESPISLQEARAQAKRSLASPPFDPRPFNPIKLSPRRH
jgi:hypothetical protein